MSSNRTEPRLYPEEIPDPDRFNDSLDSAVDASIGVVVDTVLGTQKGFDTAIAVTPHAPANMTVDIPAFQGRNDLGDHIRSATPNNGFDCSKDYLGADTVPVTAGKHRYCSIFIFFNWNNTDPIVVDSTIYYQLRTENYIIRLYKGTEVPLASTPVPPSNPGGGAIRLCDIRIRSSQTSIITSDIYLTTGHQDRIGPALLGSGGTIFKSPVGPYSGKLMEAKWGHTSFNSTPILVSSLILLDPVYAKIFPAWMYTYYCLGSVLQHDIAHRNVYIVKKINMTHPLSYPANLIDAEGIIPTGLNRFAFFWSFNVHDGLETYSGMTYFFAIAQDAASLTELQDKRIDWMAFVKIE